MRRVQWNRLATVLMAGALLSASFAFAADETAPASPPPAAPQQDTGARANRPERGDRGDRANVTGRTFGGRGTFGGLNLDDKQSELLREALQAEGDDLRKLYEKLQAASKELMHAVVAEKYDDKIVREKADAVSKLQTEITVLRAKAFSAVSPTLTQEQREQIENSRAASSLITGAGLGIASGGYGGPGGPPQDQFSDRNLRRGERGNNPPGVDPGQLRRRGGERPATPTQ
jgi:Spy/CpxP family protein refolding chaperone